MAAKLPEKKIPSTAANAINRSPNVASFDAIQHKANRPSFYEFKFGNSIEELGATRNNV